MSFDFSTDSVTPWKPRTIPLVVQIEDDNETKAIEKKKRLPLHPVDTIESMKSEDDEGNEAKSAERLAFFLLGLPLLTFSFGQILVELSKVSPLFPKVLASLGTGLQAFSDGLPKVVVAALYKFFYQWPKFLFTTFVLPVLKVVNQVLVMPVVRLIERVVETVVKPLVNLAEKVISKVVETVSFVVPWIIDKVITPPLNFIIKGAVKVVETVVTVAKAILLPVILPVIKVTQEVLVTVGQWLLAKVLAPVGRFIGRQLKRVGNTVSKTLGKAANFIADKALKPFMRAVAFIGDQLSKGFSWVASEIIWPVADKAMSMAKTSAQWVNNTVVAPAVAMAQKVFAPVVTAAKAFVKGLMRKFLGLFGSKGNQKKKSV
jgi:hypothetical protein